MIKSYYNWQVKTYYIELIYKGFGRFDVAWKFMYMNLFIDAMKWLTEYHQKSYSESFHSSFKSRYGTIAKRRLTSILAQVTARIILHNRRR